MTFLKKHSFRIWPVKTAYLVCLLLMFSGYTSCQRNISPQAQSAINLFDNLQYRQAFEAFQKLHDKFPRDPLYNYYLGAVMVELHTSDAQAISYLYAAKNKIDEPNINYYLGKACYNSFRFDEANAWFLNMKTTGKLSDIKKFALHDEIKRTALAQAFCNAYADIDVKDAVGMPYDSIASFLETLRHTDTVNLRRGSVAGSGVTFTTFDSHEQTCIVSATSGNGGNNNLYLANVGADGRIALKSALPNDINTDKEEVNPFFDIPSQTLYFSSNRNTSMGGFDVYKSVYNNKTKRWSVATQLLFPINSPFNEYYYIAQSNQDVLITDRYADNNNVLACSIAKFPDTVLVRNASPNQLLQLCSRLHINTETIANKPLTPLLPNGFDIRKSTESSSGALPNISIALMAQLTCDSALWEACMLRNILISTENKDSRAKIFSKIAKLEKKAVAYQQIANTTYSAIRADFLKPDDTTNTPQRKQTSNFSILQLTPYSKEKPFSEQPTLPDGISYRIQLGVFSKLLAFDHFGGLEPVSFEVLQDGKVYKYFVGIFNAFHDADNALNKVKELGFKEAFVIAYLNNKKVPLERAKELETTY